MCPNRSCFDSISDSVESEQVYMSDNNVCEIVGIGSVKLTLSDKRVDTFTIVRYMSALRRNLVSLGALDDNDCWYSVCNGVSHVYKNDKVVHYGTKLYEMYVLDGKCVDVSADVVVRSTVHKSTL